MESRVITWIDKAVSLAEQVVSHALAPIQWAFSTVLPKSWIKYEPDVLKAIGLAQADLPKLKAFIDSIGTGAPNAPATVSQVTALQADLAKTQADLKNINDTLAKTGNFPQAPGEPSLNAQLDQQKAADEAKIASDKAKIKSAGK